MAKKKDEGHFGRAGLSTLHDESVQPNTTEGGACLTGHEADFQKFKHKVTCNYRYQAYEQAKANKRIRRRLHSYVRKLSLFHAEDSGQLKMFIQTSVYRANSGDMSPDRYSQWLPLPKEGDWHVGGPPREISRGTFKGADKILVGHNFTRDTWPYWNNAHHLIPKGTFEAAVKEQGTKISELIQESLLKAKYNINHKINMLLIPQDREVANILGLPRHIQLKDGDIAGLDAECMDHPVYSMWTRTVKSGLNEVIQGYKGICESAEKKAKEAGHENPDPELDKKKLERLSRTLLEQILNWRGPSSPQQARTRGASLDAMATQLG